MLIIADKKIPSAAGRQLAELGNVIYFETSGITYEAVSGHPDIFLCQLNDAIAVAPNTPRYVIDALETTGVRIIPGELHVGPKYPETAKYNVVCTDSLLLHNFRYTDSAITDHADDLELVHINQGYARCNLLPLKGNRFITSDEGILRVLSNQGLEALYVDPEGIGLPGFRHGFIGGTCGVLNDTIVFLGSLEHYPEGIKVRHYLEDTGYAIVELYNGPLFDGGSLFFIG